METETTTSDAAEQRRKYEELLRRKDEIEKRKRSNPEPEKEKETYRYEELIRTNNRKSTTKDKVFNNAFRVEIKEEEERVIHMIKDPMPRPESTWFEQILEKERKIKREGTRLAQDRLKMIDKRTRYSEIVREIMSPTTKAKINPEPATIIRSSSKKDILPEDKDSVQFTERSKKTDNHIEVNRLKPRSLSRRELSPYNTRINHGRSPTPRQTLVPLKAGIN